MTKASPAPDNSEWLTRKQLVDKALRAAGWRVTPHVDGAPLARLDRCAVEEYPTLHGPADYALILAGHVVAVIEAKKLSIGPQNVLLQAERYSRGLRQAGFSWGDFGAPFLYSTNGEVIWHHDVRDDLNRSRPVMQFHTPQALGERLGQDQSGIRRLQAMPQANARVRPYQVDASTAIEKALAGRKRHMLLAMATGAPAPRIRSSVHCGESRKGIVSSSL